MPNAAKNRVLLAATAGAIPDCVIKLKFLNIHMRNRKKIRATVAGLQL